MIDAHEYFLDTYLARQQKEEIEFESAIAQVEKYHLNNLKKEIAYIKDIAERYELDEREFVEFIMSEFVYE